MTKFYPFTFLSLLCFVALFNTASGQTFRPRYNTSMGSNIPGFYEYLPEGYAENTDKYPLLIFLHGNGDRGNGSTSQLPRVLNLGLPKLLNEGTLPHSFTVNGQTHRFIILTPQFINWPVAANIKSVIDYAVANYRVNSNRIYITGFSMGGGVTFEYAGESNAYASRIAAIVPVAGASVPTMGRAQVIANNGVAVWATHNSNDEIVHVSNTNNYISYINSYNPPIPARKTIFNASGHENTTVTTYDPQFRENGMNIYEWMLQYQRNATVLPVTLTSYKAFITSSQEVTVSWSTATEKDNAYFTIERSADGSNFTTLGKITGVNAPSSYQFKDKYPLRENYYRLSQTDVDGTIQYFDILKVRMEDKTAISFGPNPAQQQIGIELNNPQRGTLTISIVNTNGMLILQRKVAKTTDVWQQNIDISTLLPGNYYLNVSVADFTYTRSFIKK